MLKHVLGNNIVFNVPLFFHSAMSCIQVSWLLFLARNNLTNQDKNDHNKTYNSYTAVGISSASSKTVIWTCMSSETCMCFRWQYIFKVNTSVLVTLLMAK